MAGTPAYMSPEQISAFSQVTPAADVYALGCCAYEMFTGAPPFVHAEVVPLLMMHLQNPVVSPRAHKPDLPVELEQVILAMLEKDPQRRPASCREVSAMLAGAVG
jgi:serine/threonine-protein kinase